jgi:hypothetical protein
MLSSIQTGMVGGRRMTDNVFIIKTIADKYLRFKKLYKFLEMFDFINREVLWYKMRVRSISSHMISCF